MDNIKIKGLDLKKKEHQCHRSPRHDRDCIEWGEFVLKKFSVWSMITPLPYDLPTQRQFMSNGERLRRKIELKMRFGKESNCGFSHFKLHTNWAVTMTPIMYGGGRKSERILFEKNHPKRAMLLIIDFAYEFLSRQCWFMRCLLLKWSPGNCLKEHVVA